MNWDFTSSFNRAGMGERTLPDIRYILNITSILGGFMFITLIILKFSIISALFLSLTVILTNFRLFIVGYLRLQMNFKAIIAGNFLYLVGVLYRSYS